MADYFATTRSNYFIVKDIAAFKTWAERRQIEIFENKDHPGKTAIVGCETGWPVFDDEGDDSNLVSDLSKHLADNQVAILMEAGAEGLRNVAGLATALDSTGRVVEISLYDIYDLARKTFGPHAEITNAEW